MTCLTPPKPWTWCVNCGIAQLNWDFKQDAKKTQIPTRKENINIINHEGLYQTIFLATKTLQKNPPWPLKKIFTLFPFPAVCYNFIQQNMETFKCFYMGPGPTLLGAVQTHQETNELLMLIKRKCILQFTHAVHAWLFNSTKRKIKRKSSVTVKITPPVTVNF